MKYAMKFWNLEDGKLYRHKGNYSYYLEKKAERDDEMESANLQRSKNLYRTELDWMRKQPRHAAQNLNRG